jgi:carbamoylphosphate synthase small subunit
MKTFRITVPYSVLCSGRYEHEIDESEVLEHFEVDSLDQVDATDLLAYLTETAMDASYDIDTEVLVQDLRENGSFEAEESNVDIEEVDA